MQVKIVIGTISFMLTMIIFGFSALREPIRMQEYGEAFEGRSIETGAHIYDNNCATCHGVEGKAEECYDAVGSQIGCQGLSLNNPQLLCGDKSARMAALDWGGSKYDFIENTVAAGRVGRGMPTWSEEYGGPMRGDQVNDVVRFVLNWEVPEEVDPTWCDFDIIDPVEVFGTVVDDFLAQEEIIYPGDAANGEELYLITYGCSACHGQNDVEGSNNVGPWLGDIAERGSTLIEGYSAEQYLFESILYPSEYISEDCPTGPCAGPPSAMPANFGERMATSQQDLADIITYLMGE